MNTSPRLHSSAAERNRGPILAELQRLLPAQGVALEIASGTGQHAAFFAAGLAGWRWQPTDAEEGALASIADWCAGLSNVLPPIQLDVRAANWAGAPERVDALFCANMLHISPWSVCAALMQGAARHLAPAGRGRLLLYGPYLVDGEPTSAGNVAFDADLRARNPDWGLRSMTEVLLQAGACGLQLQERVPMPANNLLLVLTRTELRGA